MGVGNLPPGRCNRTLGISCSLTGNSCEGVGGGEYKWQASVPSYTWFLWQFISVPENRTYFLTVVKCVWTKSTAMDFTPSKYLFPWLVSPIGFLYFYQFTFSSSSPG